jgi:hypothetical protein
MSDNQVAASSAVWECLSPEDNPLFVPKTKAPQRPLCLKHTWIPYSDTPLSCNVPSTRESRGLLSVMACKNVQANCKMLKTFGVVVANHPTVEKLDACRQSGPRPNASYAFLQTSPPASKFDLYTTESSRTLVMTAESYLALLEFFSVSWPAVEQKIKEAMASIDSNNLVAEIFPGVMLSGDGRFVVSSVVLEKFTTFSLLLDVYANSRERRGREITATLRYTDQTLHHELHRDSKYTLPIRAVAGHAKYFVFFQNVLSQDNVAVSDSQPAVPTPPPAQPVITISLPPVQPHGYHTAEGLAQSERPKKSPPHAAAIASSQDSPSPPSIRRIDSSPRGNHKRSSSPSSSHSYKKNKLSSGRDKRGLFH